MVASATIPGSSVALVLGCGEIGSAIAIALRRVGFAAVLIDDADPSWARRGMAFTDAWYFGNSTLEGEEAVFCSSVRSIPTVLRTRRAIAATTWSWLGVGEAVAPFAIVDARMRWEAASRDLKSRATPGVVTVGVGPGFVVGRDVHVAVETAPGAHTGEVVAHGATTSQRHPPSMLGGLARERFVHAEHAGHFFTRRAIGDAVVAGECVGRLGDRPVHAPRSGVLRGLSARGARIEPFANFVEIDPRGDRAACFGLQERPAKIALGVLTALARATDYSPELARSASRARRMANSTR